MRFLACRLWVLGVCGNFHLYLLFVCVCAFEGFVRLCGACGCVVRAGVWLCCRSTYRTGDRRLERITITMTIQFELPISKSATVTATMPTLTERSESAFLV
jgi:hypothetical protein